MAAFTFIMHPIVYLPIETMRSVCIKHGGAVAHEGIED